MAEPDRLASAGRHIEEVENLLDKMRARIAADPDMAATAEIKRPKRPGVFARMWAMISQMGVAVLFGTLSVVVIAVVTVHACQHQSLLSNRKLVAIRRIEELTHDRSPWVRLYAAHAANQIRRAK